MPDGQSSNVFKSYPASENKFDKTSKGSAVNNNPFDCSEGRIDRDTSPIPRVENIGIDGSQRFSDIQNTGGPNNSESIIQFDPNKDLGIGDKENNPNLFSQHLTSMENIKFQEMLV